MATTAKGRAHAWPQQMSGSSSSSSRSTSLFASSSAPPLPLVEPADFPRSGGKPIAPSLRASWSRGRRRRTRQSPARCTTSLLPASVGGGGGLWVDGGTGKRLSAERISETARSPARAMSSRSDFGDGGTVCGTSGDMGGVWPLGGGVAPSELSDASGTRIHECASGENSVSAEEEGVDGRRLTVVVGIFCASAFGAMVPDSAAIGAFASPSIRHQLPPVEAAWCQSGRVATSEASPRALAFSNFISLCVPGSVSLCVVCVPKRLNRQSSSNHLSSASLDSCSMSSYFALLSQRLP